MKVCEGCTKGELVEKIEDLQTDKNFAKRDVGRLCARLWMLQECTEPCQLEEDGPILCGNPAADDVQTIMDMALARLNQTETQ